MNYRYDLEGISKTIWLAQQASYCSDKLHRFWFTLLAFEDEAQANRWKLEHPDNPDNQYEQYRITTVSLFFTPEYLKHNDGKLEHDPYQMEGRTAQDGRDAVFPTEAK